MAYTLQIYAQHRVVNPDLGKEIVISQTSIFTQTFATFAETAEFVRIYLHQDPGWTEDCHEAAYLDFADFANGNRALLNTLKWTDLHWQLWWLLSKHGTGACVQCTTTDWIYHTDELLLTLVA